MSNEIATQKYVVGRYTFTSTLPRVGSADDKPRWHLDVDGVRQPHDFDNLEAVLLVAALWKGEQASKKVAADARVDPAHLQQPMTI